MIEYIVTFFVTDQTEPVTMPVKGEDAMKQMLTRAGNGMAWKKGHVK